MAVSQRNGCDTLAVCTGDQLSGGMIAPMFLQQRLQEAATRVERSLQYTQSVAHEAYTQLEAQQDRLGPLERKLGYQSKVLNAPDASIGAELHQEMNQLVELAKGGEQAAAELATLRQSLQGLCTQLGAYGELGCGARKTCPKSITSGPLPRELQNLQEKVKELCDRVSQLTASGERTNAEFIQMQDQFSNIREAMLGLHSHVALRDDVQQALVLVREEFMGHQRALEGEQSFDSPGSTFTIPTDVMPEQDLTDAGNALQEEWSQLLELGLANLHEGAEPRTTSVASVDASRRRRVEDMGTAGAPSETVLQGLRQELAGAVENLEAELMQVKMRCDQALSHTKETGRDVNRLRDEFREELATTSLESHFATKHEVEEMRGVLQGSLRSWAAGLHQELGDMREQLMQRLRSKIESPPQCSVSKEDLAEVRDQIRRESVDLISQQHDGANLVSRQELGRNVQSIMEELERLTDRIGKSENARQELGSPTKDIKRLFEQLNILKDRNDVAAEEAKAQIDTFEHRLHGLHQELFGSISQLEARLSRVEQRQPQEEQRNPQCAETPQLGSRDSSVDLLAEHLEKTKAAAQQAAEQAVAELDKKHNANSHTSKEYVEQEEFNGAIHAVMDELIEAQKYGMGTREDLDTLAKALETVRKRNNVLGEEVKKLMDSLDGSVHSLKEDLVEAIAELRKRASTQEASNQAEQSATRQEVLDVADMFRQELKIFTDRVQELDDQLHDNQRQKQEKMTLIEGHLQDLRAEFEHASGQLKEKGLRGSARELTDSPSDLKAVHSLEVQMEQLVAESVAAASAVHKDEISRLQQKLNESLNCLREELDSDLRAGRKDKLEEPLRMLTQG